MSQSDVVFSADETNALAIALESQVEELGDVLETCNLSVIERHQFFELLKNTQSALQKVKDGFV